jgi:serine/threonine-protein kinase
MREIYAEELEEELSSEPTIIAYDPRMPNRKPPPPLVDDDSAPTMQHKVVAAETAAAPKPSGVVPIPKAPKVVPPPKTPGDAAKKTSRSGKGEK